LKIANFSYGPTLSDFIPSAWMISFEFLEKL